jgi:L-fuconolactonase
MMAAVAAGLAAGVGLSTRDAGAAEEAPPDIIDCHTHFYDPTRPQGVPWPGKDDKLLHRRTLPDDYRAVACADRATSTTATVVVEASPWVEDNQWLLDLAAKDPFIVGVVGRLVPADAGFASNLARFAKNPLFRGIRISGRELADGLGKDGKVFTARMALLSEAGLTLDVNGGPETLPAVAALAEALPDLRIAVNHLANVRIDGKAPPEAWSKGLRAAAAGKNVYLKVSALVEGGRRDDGSPSPTDPAFYKPVLDAAWDAFGPDRLVYGSNWPVSSRFGTYAAVIGLVRAYFAARGAEALAKVLSGNSKSAYRWAKR